MLHVPSLNAFGNRREKLTIRAQLHLWNLWNPFSQLLSVDLVPYVHADGRHRASLTAGFLVQPHNSCFWLQKGLGLETHLRLASVLTAHGGSWGKSVTVTNLCNSMRNSSGETVKMIDTNLTAAWKQWAGLGQASAVRTLMLEWCLPLHRSCASL